MQTSSATTRCIDELMMAIDMYMYVIDVVLYTRYPLATLLSTVMVLTGSLDAIRQADKIVLFRQGSTTPSASQALALGSLGTMTAQPQVSFGRHAWLISPHTPPFIPTPLENKSYAHRLSICSSKTLSSRTVGIPNTPILILVLADLTTQSNTPVSYTE